MASLRKRPYITYQLDLNELSGGEHLAQLSVYTLLQLSVLDMCFCLLSPLAGMSDVRVGEGQSSIKCGVGSLRKFAIFLALNA